MTTHTTATAMATAAAVTPAALVALTLATALLLAMILTLSIGVRRVQRISGWILAPAGLCGLAFYTLAFLNGAEGVPEILQAVLRGVYTTCLMFMGRNDISSMTRLAPWFEASVGLQILFWAAHLSALFVSAAALLSTIGQKLLQTLRLFFARADTVYLIFSLHEESLRLGRELQRQGLVVLVDPRPAPELSEQVLAFGGAVRQLAYAQGGLPLERLLSQLRLRKSGHRRAVILALDASETVNIALVGNLIELLEQSGLPPERVRFTLRSHGELDYSQLAQFERAGGTRYDVDAISDAELSARLLIHELPPYRALTFDENGAAQQDFCALVIGFGQVGQHTLRQIVMNGQFAGGHFSAVVVDRDAARLSGQFAARYAGMMQAYDIRLMDLDTRSTDFYRLLDELAPKLNYVVVCLGSDEANYETTADLERAFARMEEERRPMILASVCNKRTVATTGRNIRFVDRQEQVYSSRVILRDQVDHMAMAVNVSYNEEMGGPADIRAAWRQAGYFSRESSRASADFIPAMLKMAGQIEGAPVDADAFAALLEQRPALLEHLSITEHLRWNAFHYAMGYTVMPHEEVALRAERGIDPVQKDPNRLRHACLVSWEELDALSALIGPLLGNPELDYKELDRNNVRNIPRTLAIDQLLERS